MSRIRADQILNSAGTGAPNFSQGLTGTTGTFSGNVSIGGTLTYEDVTSIDSVGIITARSGINVTGGQLNVGSNIKIGNVGVITATSFSGDGSALTGTGVGTETSINTTGIITATSFSGDGSALTGIGGTANVSTNTLSVSGVSTLTGDINSGSAIYFDYITAPSAAGSTKIYGTTEGGGTSGTLALVGQGKIAFIEGGFTRWNMINGNLETHVTTYHNLGNPSPSGGRVGNGYFQYSVDLIDNGELRLGTGDDLKLYHDGSTNNMWGAGAHPIKIATNNTERLRITSGGRVGIGESVPATQLEVKKHAQFAGVYNGVIEGSVNNNSGLILLHKLGQGQGFYFAGDIIVMSWTGQAKIDCILSAKYNNDQIGWNIRDAGGGGNNMVSKTTVKYGTVTYDGGTWVCLKKDGGGSGVTQLNGFLSSNAKSHLTDGHQTLEITSGYSSFSSSVTLN